MKVLIITPSIFPDRHSGIAKMAYNMAKQLRQKGHDITILTNKYKPNHPSSEIIGGMGYYRTAVPKRGDALHALWPLETR